MENMRSFTALFLGLALYSWNAFSATAGQNLLVDRIDSVSVSAGLPLSSLKVMKSGNGRKKQVWTIVGVENGRFEIIGNDSSDADQVAWNCSKYDKDGNRVKPAKADQFCHRLFVMVLGKFSKTPEWFAEKLIDEALKEKITVDRRLDDFSFETDGEFFAIRRWSRLNAR